jgi:hypothetical protein
MLSIDGADDVRSKRSRISSQASIGRRRSEIRVLMTQSKDNPTPKECGDAYPIAVQRIRRSEMFFRKALNKFGSESPRPESPVTIVVC